MRWNRFLTPGRVIAAGFAFLILVGTGSAPAADLSPAGAVPVLYRRPVHGHQRRVHHRAFLDPVQRRAFRIRTGGRCLLLIQVGGMGITTLGVGIILLTGKKIGIRERTLI